LKGKDDQVKQRHIDWQDATYRKLIAEVPFPANIPRVGVDTLRAVLKAIYDVDSGRPCWPGQAKLADMAGCCERTLREALAVLEHRLGLIVSYRAKPKGSTTRQTLMHYIIVWTELDIRRQLGNRPLPVDTDPLPVDTDPLPVDILPDNILARAQRNGEGKEEGKELPVPVPGRPTADSGSAGCFHQESENVKFAEWANSPRAVTEGSDTEFAADPRSDLSERQCESELWSRIDTAADPRMDLSELHDLRTRAVGPLPARWQVSDGSWRDLRGSVYSHLRLETLKQPGQLARWHQRQLSVSCPVFGPTELDLLMIWCLARHAAECPMEEIRRNRVAYFVHLCAKCKWSKGLRYLPWALDLLERYRARQANVPNELELEVAR
jgi:hypothetical protein